MLAPVGVEGRVALPQGGRRVDSAGGTKSDQPSHRSPAKGAQLCKTPAMTPSARSALLVVLRRYGEPKPSDAPRAPAEAGPEGARGARVAVRDERVGRPRVAERREDEAAPRRRLCGGGLERGDRPHAAGEKVDAPLQAIVIRANPRQSEEVETDAAAPARLHRKEEEEAGWRQAIRLDALGP